jgi:hypothetical protein
MPTHLNGLVLRVQRFVLPDMCSYIVEKPRFRKYSTFILSAYDTGTLDMGGAVADGSVAWSFVDLGGHRSLSGGVNIHRLMIICLTRPYGFPRIRER